MQPGSTQPGDAGIPWAQLSGEQTEKIVATLLCLANPEANRIRAAQGDGGVDILIPNQPAGAQPASQAGVGGVVEAHQFDVYQVKAYASGLNSGRRSKIRHSLETVAATALQVDTWWLTIPLDPTLDNHQKFLAELDTTVPFSCKWFGLAQLDGLAARFPEVGNYFLRGGMARVEANIEDLLALQRADDDAGRAEGKLLSHQQIADRLTALSRALNREDPHFFYELQTTRDQPVFAPRPGLVTSVATGSPDGYVIVHVVERFHGAAAERPSTAKFKFDLDALDPAQNEAVEDFLTYGSPLEAIPATDLHLELPAGLGGTHPAASVWISAVDDPDKTPFRRRLAVYAPDGTELASAIFVMQPSTTGIRGGLRAQGLDVSGTVELQMLFNPSATEQEPGSTFRLSKRDFAGTSPNELLPAANLLAAFTHPNRFGIAHEHGPRVGGLTDIPVAPAPMLTQRQREVISALADIQRNVYGELITPHLDEMEHEELKTILVAGALARHVVVKDSWVQQTLPMPDTGIPEDGPQQVGMRASADYTIGTQTVQFHGLRIQYESATCTCGPPDADGAPTMLLTPGDNDTCLAHWPDPATRDA